MSGGGRLVVAGLAVALAACGESPTITHPFVPTADGGGFFPGGRPDALPPTERPQCSDLAWACWPMPNPAAAGLPNPARYDTRAADVVIDEVTTLMWKKVAFEGMSDWATAKQLCADLVIRGFDGWRLPTRVELVSLVDFARTSPAIDGDAFPGTAGNFWTSSPAPGSGTPARAWQVSFAGGGATTIASETFMGGVRCVRSQLPPGQPVARYNIVGLAPDETVTDLGTGLEWRRAALDGTYTFGQAQLQCGAAGSGWRVPSVKELQTLVDDDKTAAPHLDDTVFLGTPTGRAPFWTSSRSADLANAAWFVNFGTGESADATLVTGALLDQPYQVRCVR